MEQATQIVRYYHSDIIVQRHSFLSDLNMQPNMGGFTSSFPTKTPICFMRQNLHKASETHLCPYNRELQFGMFNVLFSYSHTPLFLQT